MAPIIINGNRRVGTTCARASSPSSHRNAEMETAKAAVDADVDASSSFSSSSAAAAAAAVVVAAPSTTKTTSTTTTTTTTSTTKEATSVADNARGNIERQRAKSTYRYVEDVNSGLRLDMELRSMLHNSVSAVQSIQVIETCFGKTLVTDGKTQSSAHDESVYHESLVHPAMFWCAHRNEHRRRGGRTTTTTTATNDHDDASTTSPEDVRGGGWPRSVFIGGGGELATAREVLRHHATVRRVVMVDIDPDVVEVCRRHMPEWGGDAVLHHPSLEYVIGDARAYLRDNADKFDVIVMDVTDPIEYGPAEMLYNVEFYDIAKSRLERDGVFVTQAGSASFVPLGTTTTTTNGEMTLGNDGENENDDEGSCLAPIRNTLARVFDNALPYTAPVPSFGEDWGYVIAYDDVDDARISSSSLLPSLSSNDTATNTNGRVIAQVSDMTREYIDDMIEERIGTVDGVPDHASVIRDRERRGTRSRRGDDGDVGGTSNDNNGATTTNERDGTTSAIMGREVLRHYDGIAHHGLFALSKQLRRSIMDDDRVMTEANPIYMY